MSSVHWFLITLLGDSGNSRRNRVSGNDLLRSMFLCNTCSTEAKNLHLSVADRTAVGSTVEEWGGVRMGRYVFAAS